MKYCFVLILLIGMNGNELLGCTIFSITKDGKTVYGQNLDWQNPVTGYVIVNKRGVYKSVLDWKGRWPASKNNNRANITWTSKYGSVTFTYLGRDFIEGGMNEVGLMVDEASFVAKYPNEDHRPGISCGQWMQYQLDNFETVEEVIEHLDDLRPDGEGWHYLIADKSGYSCVIEYLDGSPTIYTGESLPYPILSNCSYSQALSHIPMDKSFGGEIDISSGTDAYGRFIKAASLLQNYTDDNANMVDYAFHILNEVGNETTRRSVVYDSYNRQVLWISEKINEARWIDLRDIDFSEVQPALMMDADFNSKGLVNSYLEVYSNDVLFNLLTSKFDAISSSTEELLKTRGYTLNEALMKIILYPDKVNSMALLPGGDFIMGYNSEGNDDFNPAHLVIIDPFYIDRFEVTNGEYIEFCEATGYKLPLFWNTKLFKSGKDFLDYPVIGINWYDANEYAKWKGKRLPTEAEWEYAARGGLVGAEYPNRNEIVTIEIYQSDLCWQNQIKVAGLSQPNGYGLYNMAGNVWEWVSDGYSDDYYQHSIIKNPKGPIESRFRVIRGGSWISGPMCKKVYYRKGLPPSWYDVGVGFRCVKDCKAEN